MRCRESAQNAPPQKKDIIFKNLDGFRTLAFLAVFSLHSFLWLAPEPKSNFQIFARILMTINGASGLIGVQFFFVLSGFLITFLLLHEQLQHGRIHIRKFYARRILRIWPLYYLVILLGFGLYPCLVRALGQNYQEHCNLTAFLFLAANFDTMHVFPSPILGVQWSVAIEEQFYAIWPWLLKVKHSASQLALMVIIFFSSVAFRLAHSAPSEHSELIFHSFSAMGDLACGGIAAWICTYSVRIQGNLQRLDGRWIALAYLFGITWLFAVDVMGSPSGQVINALFFSFVIIEQNYCENSLFKMSRLSYFTKLGKYTYSLYLLHMIPITIFRYVDGWASWFHSSFIFFVLQALAALALSIALSVLSYHYFEYPFLRLKNHFNPSLPSQGQN